MLDSGARLTGDRPLEHSSASPNAAHAIELRARVEAAIEQTIRPLIAADGGDILIVTWREGSVVLRLAGSCSGCPGRPYTMARLIEPVLREILGASAEITLEAG